MKVETITLRFCLLLAFLALASTTASAHCDTMDGPVVSAARIALQSKDVTPVLIWVKKEYESEVRSAFIKTLSVRAQSAEAKELADMYFFETAVRLHRMGEGEPYTGIKPAGTPLHPAVAAAEKALSENSVDRLRAELNEKVSSALSRKFAEVLETRKHAQESLQAGRAYVAAYVELMHFVEQLYDTAGGVHAKD
jgi:uncharacterized protein DUF6448